MVKRKCNCKFIDILLSIISHQSMVIESYQKGNNGKIILRKGIGKLAKKSKRISKTQIFHYPNASKAKTMPKLSTRL